MKRYGFLVWAVIGGLALVLSACSAPQSTTKVVCPINVTALQGGEPKDCVTWDGNALSNDKATRYMIDDALELGPNQTGIYRPSGDDRPVQIFEGLGYHTAPKKYSVVVEVGQRDIYTAESCDQGAYKECVGPLDDLQLANGVTAVANISVGLQPVVTPENATDWLEIGGYAGFMGQFWKEVRGYRNMTSDVIPDFANQNNTVIEFTQRYMEKLGQWQYVNLFTLTDFSFRSFVIGDEALRSAMAEARAAQQKAIEEAKLLDLLMANEEKRQQLETMRANFMATLEAGRAESFAAQVATICADIPDVDACTRRVWVYISGQENPPTLDSNGNVIGQPGTSTP